MSVSTWLTTLSSAFALFLGIYNFLHARKKESEERQEKESKKSEEEAEWQMYAMLVEASKKGLVWEPENDSTEQRRLERLVEKGRAERLPGGYYSIPNQGIRMSK